MEMTETPDHPNGGSPIVETVLLGPSGGRLGKARDQESDM